MSMRFDTYIPDYANNIAVVSGTTWYGALVPLYNACGISYHILSTNGAAGTLSFGATNFAGVPSAYTAAGGLPPFTGGTNLSLAANASNGTALVLTNAQTMFQSCYFFFAPSAAGNITIAVNIRRFGD